MEKTSSNAGGILGDPSTSNIFQPIASEEDDQPPTPYKNALLNDGVVPVNAKENDTNASFASLELQEKTSEETQVGVAPLTPKEKAVIGPPASIPKGVEAQVIVHDPDFIPPNVELLAELTDILNKPFFVGNSESILPKKPDVVQGDPPPLNVFKDDQNTSKSNVETPVPDENQIVMAIPAAEKQKEYENACIANRKGKKEREKDKKKMNEPVSIPNTRSRSLPPRDKHERSLPKGTSYK